MNIMYYILIIWNLFVFAFYGVDKQKARGNKHRIKESTLILFAFLMGALGAIIGMKIFRHKTRKTKFKFLVPLALILNIAIIFVTFLLHNS